MQKTVKKILIADDDSAILEAMTCILEDDGYIVETTLDGNSVFKLMDECPADLILLDITMIGSDGGAICKLLKSKTATKRVPVILVSADRAIATIARTVGANDFIAKPFQLHVFLNKVKSQLTA